MDWTQALIVIILFGTNLWVTIMLHLQTDRKIDANRREIAETLNKMLGQEEKPKKNDHQDKKK